VTDDESMQLASGIAAFEAKEFRRAWQMLQPLAEAGDAEAQYRCAVMAQNGLGVVARPQQAFEMMHAAAGQELGIAQHGLGVMYLFGECTDKNTELAIEWLEKAGESGLAGAWTTLGMIYNEGQGVAVDKEKAAECYRRAGFDPAEFL